MAWDPSPVCEFNFPSVLYIAATSPAGAAAPPPPPATGPEPIPSSLCTNLKAKR
jgi:hypothetical protein